MTKLVCPVPAAVVGVSLTGLLVLLVEDEMMLSMLVEDWLIDQGCAVVGPAATLARARGLAATETIDVAILDVNLDDQPVYEVADILAARGIAFVFTTGYAAIDMDRRFRNSLVVQKPFRVSDLVAAVGAVRDAALLAAAG